MYLQVKKAIKAVGLPYKVVKNQNCAQPALGAFEVRLQGKLVFSKIKLGCWPFWNCLAQNLEQIEKCIQNSKRYFIKGRQALGTDGDQRE